MMVRNLKTVTDVVDAFGGTKATAEWAGIGESAVSNWISRGFIPPGWHFRLTEHFEKLNMKVARSAFGETEPDTLRRRGFQPAA